MAKRSPTYVCQSCGAVTTRWAGRCGSCGDWNSISEEAGVASEAPPGTGLAKAAKGKRVALESLDQDIKQVPRFTAGIPELDRVTGGGLVPGSALLVGGEPGIGKSTLLLQLAAKLASSGRQAVYITGEEATAQVKLRAERLGLSRAPVGLAAETNVANIIATLSQAKAPDLVVIDSIQTLWIDSLEAAPGTVSQVRAASQALIRYAKLSGSVVLLVGHVTKEGQIAGPKVVEHMVDTVLYFEGDNGNDFRILRAVKNRFGPAHEIGVFEMASDGLREVANPSALFLGDRETASPGSAVFAGIEGTRPILVEIQALVAQSSLGTPRRAVVGWDSSRLAMLLAVLEARCGIPFAGHDVYLNVAGGLKITEPACDLAAAAALVSSLSGTVLPAQSVYFGEISLSGGIRPSTQMSMRLREASKLGFRRAVLPAAGDLDRGHDALALDRIDHVRKLVGPLRTDAGNARSPFAPVETSV